MNVCIKKNHEEREICAQFKCDALKTTRFSFLSLSMLKMIHVVLPTSITFASFAKIDTCVRTKMALKCGNKLVKSHNSCNYQVPRG